MAVMGKAEREILKKAKRVFVDFQSVEEEQLIRSYILCNDLFGSKGVEIVHDDRIRLLCGKIDFVVNSLPRFERQYIKYRYGFEDGKLYTDEEIADLMQLPAARISSIKGIAYRQIRGSKNNLFVTSVLKSLELKNESYRESNGILQNQMLELMKDPVVMAANSIDKLQWTARTRNLLRGNGIYTIQQLMNLRSEHILKWRGAGKACVSEVLNNQKKVKK